MAIILPLIILGFVPLFTIAQEPHNDHRNETNDEDDTKDMFEEMMSRYEVKLIELLDDWNSRESINIFGNMIRLEKIAGARDPQLEPGHDHQRDPLVSRIDEFLKTRKIEIRLPNGDSANAAKPDLVSRAFGVNHQVGNFDVELRKLSSGSAEGRAKLKRLFLPILMALKLKAIVVLPIFMTLIAVIGIKGLGIGILALLLSSAVALKALLTVPGAHHAAFVGPPLPKIRFGRPVGHHHHRYEASSEDRWNRGGLAPGYVSEQDEAIADPAYVVTQEEEIVEGVDQFSYPEIHQR